MATTTLRSVAFALAVASAGTGSAQTPLGAVHCPGEPNSTGARATLTALGELDVAQNDLTLRAGGLPPQALGYALVSRQRDLVPLVGGGVGTLCLGPLFGRLSAQIVVAGATGAADVPLDLTQLPSPTGPFAVAHGETLLFQLWYRDSASGGVATSNLTDGLTVTFAPPPWFAGQQIYAGYVISARLADLDRDGDLDVVSGGYSPLGVAVHWNEGAGGFGPRTLLMALPQTGTPFTVDVDLDGITDLLVSMATTTPITYLLRGRDGTTFEPPQQLPLPTLGRVLLADDVDGDGDVDLVALSYFGSSMPRVDLFYGDGAGTFQQGPLLAYSAATDALLADVEADGDQDFVLYGWNTPVLVVRNLGGGLFGAPEPYVLAPQSLHAPVRVTDLDGDGLPDLARGGHGFVSVKLNRGDGTFGLEARYDAPTHVRIITALDADADGDIDLVLEGYSTTTSRWSPIWLMDNRGGGVFTLQSAPVGEVPGIGLLPCDLDGQGPLDLVGFDPDRQTVHATFDTGSVAYDVTPPDPWTLVLSLRALSWDTGDIDADGDDEFVVMCSLDDPNQAEYFAVDLTPNGPGVIASWPMPIDANLLKCADFDGDGRSDFLYHRQSALHVALVQASGQLVPAGPPVTAAPHDVALGDFDSDGDLDVIMATSAQNEDIRLLENAGNGQLTYQPNRVPSTPIGPRRCNRLASGDVDGDGNLDLIGANSSNNFVCWYRNLGNGVFANRVEIVLPNYITGIHPFDLDGDGDLDVLTRTGSRPRFALWNDGVGDLSTLSDWTLRGAFGDEFAVEDVEGDGDADLAVIFKDEGAVQVLLSDGLGEVAETLVVPWHGFNTYSPRVVLADLDGDDDCELIWIDSTYFIRIVENQLR